MESNVDGTRPLVIAADMDIRRVERVITAARKLGKKEVLLATFRNQMEALAHGRFPTGRRNDTPAY